jgi:restriction endonuclease Mrr
LWHSIRPGNLERLVTEIFRANHARSEVFHVGRPVDGGVDVVFVDSGRRQWLIQVKRRGCDSASEGVETIRNLLGTVLLHGAVRGIVVSTADHFTYQAYRAQSRAEQIGYQIHLVDKGKLHRMLDPLLPDRPWLRFIREEHPQWRDYFAAAIPSRRQLRLF